jgi:hypothetical protein
MAAGADAGRWQVSATLVLAIVSTSLLLGTIWVCAGIVMRMAKKCDEQEAAIHRAAIIEHLRLYDALGAIESELNRPDSERKYHGKEWCIRQHLKRGRNPTSEDLSATQREARDLLFKNRGGK